MTHANSYPLAARKSRPNGQWANPTDGAPALTAMLAAAFPGRSIVVRFSSGAAVAVFDEPPLTAPEQSTLGDTYAAWVPTDPPAEPPA